MTGAEMLGLIWQDDPYNHPAWESFKEEMRDNQYGREPLNQAWWFFRLGWAAKERNLKVIEGGKR